MIEATAPVAAIVYIGACGQRHVGIDDRGGRGPGRVDLDVVVAGRDVEVTGDRAERHVGQRVDDRVVEIDVDRGSVGRGVQDADLARYRRRWRPPRPKG